MPERISTYLEDETVEIVEELADHHDISRSAGLKLLVREGLGQRSLRYQYELLDAKLNRALSELGIHNISEEIAENRYEFALNNSIPESNLDAELEDLPHPEFMLGSLGYEGGPAEEQAKQSQTD